MPLAGQFPLPRAGQQRWPARLTDTDMTNLIDFEALSRIGLGASMRQQLAGGVADPAARPMRLVEIQREHLLLHDGHSAQRARCSPVLQHDLQQQQETLAVGDWVLARPYQGGAAAPAWVVSCRLLPNNQFARRTVRRDADDRAGAQRQVLVSNVDTALLVMGLDRDFNLRRLERYLALAQLAGVAAVLVLSKADTVAPTQQARLLDLARAALPSGVSALALDVRQPAAAVALAPWLARGQTLVLLGSSGAGKSTLANTLRAWDHTGLGDGGPAGQPAVGAPVEAVDGQASRAGSWRTTGAVREDDRRGRHTTTVRTLLPLPGGACLIDTPGLRALRLDLEQARQLADAFGDVARWAVHCRFRDCQHHQEPGCAVREALPEARLHNFHKLLREAGRDGQTVLQRRTQLNLWKLRSRNATLRLRAKRDGEA